MTKRAVVSNASDMFKLKGITDEQYAKLPKQCKVLIDVLKENEGELTRADYRDKLIDATETLITIGEGDKAVQKPRLETGQDVMAIVRYYSPKLIKDGIWEVVKPPKAETKIKVSTRKPKNEKVEVVEPEQTTVEADKVEEAQPAASILD